MPSDPATLRTGSAKANNRLGFGLQLTTLPYLGFVPDDLMCGEIAGVLEDRRVVRPRASGAVRYDVRGLSCGRCGGTLIPSGEERSPVPAADLPDGSPASLS